MKLGAIPSIILLIVVAYLGIPSANNILFMFIDSITAGFCPDVAGVCNMIPTLKIMVSIIAGLGFIGLLFRIMGQIFRGEFFRAKKPQQ